VACDAWVTHPIDTAGRPVLSSPAIPQPKTGQQARRYRNMSTTNPIAGAARIIAYSVAPTQLCVVGIDVHEDEVDGFLTDPRVNLPLDESLVESIRTHGVQKPVDVLIRDGRAYVVDGRRRTLHARAAGVGSIPILVKRDVDDSLDAEFFAILGNAHRLDDDALTEANKAQRLLDLGMERGRVLEAFGWSKATLKNRLVLLSLAPGVTKLVSKGQLSPIAAVQLKKLSPEEQETHAAALAESPEGQIKRAKAERKARENGQDEAHVRPTVTMVKQVLETEAAGDLDENVVRVMKWLIGEGSHTKVAGLAKCLRQVEEAKEAAAAERSERRRSKKKTKARKAPLRLSDLVNARASN
jgi:ParB/RepB/Spo0J family partition protein